MKKLLVVVLSIVLIITVIPFGTFEFTASATTTNTEEYYTYTTDGDAVTIVDVDESISGAVEIPSTLDELPVKYIGDNAFECCYNIESVIIPYGVVTIGFYSFSGCYSMTSVSIPDSVTYISDGAFSGCYNLESVIIPENVTEINSDVFSTCAFENITIPNNVTTIDDYAFRDCINLKSIFVPDSVTSIGDYAFQYCYELSEISLPDSIIDIGEEAFAQTAYYNDENNWENGIFYIGNHLIAAEKTISGEVEIKANTRFIASYAFSDCTELVSITIPDSVFKIGNYAFNNCTNLTKVNLGSGITDIGNSAFENCTSITEIEFDDNITSIGYRAFYGCSGLTKIIIPNSVVSIDTYAFNSCTSLSDITISDSVKNIGSRAFYNTAYYNDESNWEDQVLYIDNHLISAKTTITGEYKIKENTKTIATYAFQNCIEINNFIMPNSLICIGSNAFYNCDGLTVVTIPDGITEISDSLFQNCNGLMKVIIPDSVTIIDDNAFSGCDSLCEITISNSVTSIGDHVFFGCESLVNIIIPDSVTDIGSGVFNGCTNLSNVTLGKGITSINSGTFNNCTTLVSINIPDNIKSIDDKAFYGCTALASVEIPNSIQNISETSFNACTALSAINVDENNNSFSSINGVLFNKDITKIIKYPVGKSETSYDIPNGVKSIGSYAFGSCKSLTNVTIPNSVESIGDNAFYYCYYLTNIIIPNGVKYIGESAFNMCGSLTSISLSNGITRINDYTFAGCYKLENITLPNSVSSIGYNAFSDCRKLSSLVIPSSVKSIGDYAFSACHTLSNLIIPDSVTSIGADIFYLGSSCNTIYGYDGSYAQTYAAENDITFVAMDDESYFAYPYIKLSNTDNDLEYPIYDEESFANQLESWIKYSQYAEVFNVYLEQGYTYKDLLEFTINIPVVADSGEAYLIEGTTTIGEETYSVKIKDTMAYIIFADLTQKYMNNVIDNVEIKISKGETSDAYKYFLEKIKNFNTQYYYFQDTLNGGDAFNQTLYSLLLAKTAMAIVDGLKVEYKSGEIKYLIYGTDEYNDTVANLYTEDIVSTIPLKSYSYFTDMYKANVSESPKYYDDLYYYVLSGGDTSYLNSYYDKTLKGYSTIIKDTNKLIKIVKDGEVGDTSSWISLGFDNINYFAETYNWNCTDEISDAKEAWEWADSTIDVVSSISSGSLFGLMGGVYSLTDKYINEVKKVYENAESTEAGWYALAYYYFGRENPNVLKAIVDPDTGAVTFSSNTVSSMALYGVPFNNNDPIQKDLMLYFEKNLWAKENIYSPAEDMKFYLWNASNVANSIMDIDCCDYRNTMLHYILAEINFNEDNKGVYFSASVVANDSTLGSVFGSGSYLANTNVNLTAEPNENCSFVAWKNADNDSVISTDLNYNFTITSNINIKAVFIGEKEVIYNMPNITQNPQNATYYKGQQAEELKVSAYVNDESSLSFDWYYSPSNSNSSGTYLCSGETFTPSTLQEGTSYYYAVISSDCNDVNNSYEPIQVKTDVAKIVVTDPITLGLNISIGPNKTTYVVGEEFNTLGMVVELQYSDGSSVEIQDYSLICDFSTVGKKKVMVEYLGFVQYVEVEVITEVLLEEQNLKFDGASLTLTDSIAVNYKVKKTVTSEYGFEDLYVKFIFNDKEYVVNYYTEDNDYFIFTFGNIFPNYINDTIYATLCGTKDGISYASAVKEYSVAEYCYNMLSEYATSDNAELKTLLVDLLNYGATAQIYTDYNTALLANASLSDEQASWGTETADELNNALNAKHEEIDNPTVKWKSVGLNLKDSVSIRFKIAAESKEELTVKITSESGVKWTLENSSFESAGSGCYYVYFEDLAVYQMREKIYVTVYNGETAVSNTLCYSIESYAYAAQSSSDENLKNLLDTMIKYGDSAYNYKLSGN